MGLKEFYHGKRVLVTGHTGFKGAWLCWLLHQLGAHVVGFSLPDEYPDRDSLFKLTQLADHLDHHEGDIRQQQQFKECLETSKPTIVFHMAAQALVIDGYEHPVNTFHTNTQGVVNVLDAVRDIASIQSIVVITTDKCYENLEQHQAYVETDRLGGHDPYSASKAMAELAVSSYQRSFFQKTLQGLASARAGNVLGGGDFASHRIIPDIVRSIQTNEEVVLRSPSSLRPWQHVLDVLYGYLVLAKCLHDNASKYSTAFNFSPSDVGPQYTVEFLVDMFIKKIEQGSYCVDSSRAVHHEAGLLQLDSSKAKDMLAWSSALSFEETLHWTADWYKAYLNDATQSHDITLKQIDQYLSLWT